MFSSRSGGVRARPLRINEIAVALAVKSFCNDTTGFGPEVTGVQITTHTHTHVRSTLGSDSNIREFLLLMLRLYTQKLLSKYGNVQGTMPAELSIDVGLMNS